MSDNLEEVLQLLEERLEQHDESRKKVQAKTERDVLQKK